MRRRIPTLFLLAIVSSASAVAAEPTPADVATADRAFQDGRALMKQAKFAQACTRFEESDRLDPQFGTRFNLADCYEKLGRLDRALALYEDLAAHDDYAPRRQKSQALAAALRPRVAWLTIAVTPVDAAHLDLTLDGVDIDTTRRPIALGTHELRAHADGFEPVTRSVRITNEGSDTVARIELTEVRTTPMPPTTNERRTYATWTFVGAGVLVVGGAVFGGLAFKKWDDARAICNGTQCGNPDDLARANATADRATTFAHLADGALALGAVATAVGVTLWVTSPSGIVVEPRASTTSAELVISGRW